MGGSKPSALAKLPKGQRCHFLIGPVSSWFMPNISDLWTQPQDKSTPDHEVNESDEDDDDISKLVICCSQETKQVSETEFKMKSYYAYGSIGCFCYGSIECCDKYDKINDNGTTPGEFDTQYSYEQKNSYSATIDNLIDIKEDNSKVTCLKFNKTSSKPFIMVLTENGALLIHDCFHNENIIHFKKNEIVNKLLGDRFASQDSDQMLQLREHQPPIKKRPRLVVYQQINSFVWPQMKHAFLGISLLKEKTNLLVWLKMKDLTSARQANGHYAITKTDLIESHEILKLNLDPTSNLISPICCMESSNLNNGASCIMAVGMDDGAIVVVSVDFISGQSNRIVKLLRHNDQICSLSLYTGDIDKYPMGLLASMSRGGLALIWDIDNELYFADYHAVPQEAAAAFNGNKHSKRQVIDTKINWFSMSFVKLVERKQLYLAVSNSSSGISFLEIPDKVRASKVRLMEAGLMNRGKNNSNNNNNNKRRNNKNNKQQNKSMSSSSENNEQHQQQSISHHALIFNLVFDPISSIISTCSLDGNHIIWSCKHKQVQASQSVNSNDSKTPLEPEMAAKLKAEFLIPTMHNQARTHAIRFNPIREDLLAFALGKAGLRFYHVPKDAMARRFNMTTTHNLIVRQVAKSQIVPSSLAWNNSQEYRLAIGTSEGKVLRADLMPGRRQCNLIEARREEFLKKEASPRLLETSDDNPDDLFDVEYRPVERILEKRSSEIACGSITKVSADSALHNQKVASSKGSSINIVGNEQHHCDATATPAGTTDNSDAIYSLCWGPNPLAPSDLTRSAIYAVGITSHRLFIYYSKKESSEKLTDYLCEYERAQQQLRKQHQQQQLQHKQLELANLPEAREQATKVMWKSSRDLMALGTISGKIIIASYGANSHDHANNYEFQHRAFQRLAILEGGLLGASYIQCLAWHPSADKDNENYYYLACSSNESPVLVYNLKKKCQIAGCADDDRDCFPTFSLDAHKKAVSDVAWSPHEPDQLATCSFDRNCLVWKLNDRSVIYGESTATSSLVSRFSARDRLFTLEWSLDDDDLILTSGNDSTVWAWRPSENVNVTTTTVASKTNGAATLDRGLPETNIGPPAAAPVK